jgi:hypothetical protein
MPDIQMNLFSDGDEIHSSPIDILKNRTPHNPLSPVVVSYGGGKNSTAMLIVLATMGVKVDLILFADTGGEMPETYEFIDKFREWLTTHGMPDITTVRAKERPPSKLRKSSISAMNNFYFLLRHRLQLHPFVIAYALFWVGVTKSRPSTLEEYCLSSEILPSKSYGKSACSVQWKIDPQNEFVTEWLIKNNLCGIKKKGRSLVVDYPVRKLIGFHSKEVHRLIDKSTRMMRNLDDGIYRNEYPLMTLGVDESMCVRIIEGAGIGVPPKSSCFFCPNKKPSEIVSMSQELIERALLIESCASRGVHHRDNTSVKGLGRSFAWSDMHSLTELEKLGLDFRSSSKSCHCLD